MDWASVAARTRISCVLVNATGRDSLSKKNVGFPSSKSEYLILFILYVVTPLTIYKNGITTLSGSGVIVDSEKRLVVTSGAILAPFLAQDEMTKVKTIM